MSHEISAKVKVLGNEVAGAYKKIFGAPLILSSCKHEIRDTKSLIKDEAWFRTFHGMPNGSTKVRLICRKKGEITVDYHG